MGPIAKEKAAAARRVKAKRELRKVFRNRMVGEEMVEPSALKDHPLNWRTHSEDQRSAMREVLETVGWVQKVVANKRTGFILDGHLRVEEARVRGEKVPVVWVDLSAADERKMLTVFDPIGQMAGVDRRRLREAITGVDGESEAMKALLIALREKAGIRDKAEQRPEVPFTEELMETQNYFVLTFSNAVDWLHLQSLFPLKEVKSLRSKGRFQQIGTGRVVDGVEFIRKIKGET